MLLMQQSQGLWVAWNAGNGTSCPKVVEHNYMMKEPNVTNTVAQVVMNHRILVARIAPDDAGLGAAAGASQQRSSLA